MKQTVVITGADGFIGRHLAKFFSEHEFAVYAITIPNSPMVSCIQNIPNVVVLKENLLNWKNFAERLPNNPSAVIHLAWEGVSPEKRNSTLLQMKNIEICAQAVYLAAHIRAQRFILPGSTAEYSYCGQPINATACPSPQNAYGAAKIAARYLCGALCEELEVPYIYAVITGIYAADRADNNVIYYTISKLLEKLRPSFTRLEQLWDYVNIDDVTLAFYLMTIRGRGGAFYTVGHGDNWPLSNYIYQIRDIIDPSLPLGIGEIEYKNDKIPSSCVDLTSLRVDTGFVPRIPFEVGIKDVIATMQKQRKLDADER